MTSMFLTLNKQTRRMPRHWETVLCNTSDMYYWFFKEELFVNHFAEHSRGWFSVRYRVTEFDRRPLRYYSHGYNSASKISLVGRNGIWKDEYCPEIRPRELSWKSGTLNSPTILPRPSSVSFSYTFSLLIYWLVVWAGKPWGLMGFFDLITTCENCLFRNPPLGHLSSQNQYLNIV